MSFTLLPWRRSHPRGPVFIRPLLSDPDTAWHLIDADTGATLARRVRAAVDSPARRTGLLGRDSLEDEALIIAPSNAVHTLFMRFPIDVLFTDRAGRVLRGVSDVRPWRLTASLRGFAAIELPAGTIARSGTRAGHVVRLRAGAGH